MGGGGGGGGRKQNKKQENRLSLLPLSFLLSSFLFLLSFCLSLSLVTSHPPIHKHRHVELKC